ncbi:hypothetical protein COU36_04990 [Candidatus Micrarchaeota archaeon CG10_big_fil_rev_8_21_14_0_10_59_7]|nr:MAG: hypothetical protein COU36_04990 [Candidatus Micrarchaeota archaeon CG10_big_fil_rev_8_21_14_0_10_59_7]
MDEQAFRNVAVSGTIAEAKRPMLVMTTRYDYMMAHLPDYKAMIRYRLYAYVSFIVGAALVLAVPIAGVAALFLGAYFYQMHKLQRSKTVENKRTVMIGH